VCYIFGMGERMPHKVTLGKKEVSLGDISKKFSSTEWGEKLKGNARYSRHKPEELTTKEWEKILGGDVNNLDHLVVTKGIASSFLKSCENPGNEWSGDLSKEARFSLEEQQLLLLTATVHDWGEAVKGDIPYYDKKEEQHYEEMRELQILINKILGDILEGEEKEEIEKKAKQIVDILTDVSSKLGKAFNAIEVIGYTRTGIRAYNESEKMLDGEMKIRLRSMGIRVVPDMARILLDYAKIYPPVATYINYHHETINKIFIEGENPEIRASIPNFEEARNRWLSQNI